MEEHNTHCTRYVKVAYQFTGPIVNGKRDRKTAVFTRLRCKSWQCPFCSLKNASTWRLHLLERLPEVSNEWFLMTLTADRFTRSMESSLENIRSKIDVLIKRMKRVFGEGIEYVRVYEKHPSSRALHAHFIISGITPFVALGCSAKLRPMCIGVLRRVGRNGVWTAQTWLKKICQELKMGYMATLEQITGDTKRCVFYITKYMTKEQQNFHVPYLRHVQVTKGIGSPGGEESTGWIVANTIEAAMFAPNAQIVDLNTGEIINNDYWELHHWYPIEDER